MKKFFIVVLIAVGLIFVYGAINAIVMVFDTDTLKYNVSTSDKVDLEKFKEHSDYHTYVNQFEENYPQSDITLQGSDYIDGTDVTILGSYKGEENVIETLETSVVNYEVDLSVAGFYQLEITYFPETTHSSSANIERGDRKSTRLNSSHTM